jgi:hypothetical protein
VKYLRGRHGLHVHLIVVVGQEAVIDSSCSIRLLVEKRVPTISLTMNPSRAIWINALDTDPVKCVAELRYRVARLGLRKATLIGVHHLGFLMDPVEYTLM